MLVAIETKYLTATNFRGMRVKAIARRRDSGVYPMREISLTDAWDHGSNAEDNHARVAKLLAAKLGWSGLYIGGSLDGAGYAFVNAGKCPLARRWPDEFGKEDRDYFIVEEGPGK